MAENKEKLQICSRLSSQQIKLHKHRLKAEVSLVKSKQTRLLTKAEHYDSL